MKRLDFERFDIDPELLVRDLDTYPSSYCFIARSEKLQEFLAGEFGREGLCLKVFNRELELPYEGIEDFVWGRANLVEATKIQNLFALHGLSPRVYELVFLNGGRPGQVTDYLSGREGEWHAHKVRELSERYGVGTKKWQDFGPRNWVGGKFVDFSEFFFKNPDAYKQSLVERAYTRITRSNPSGIAYQAVPELDINGTRNLEHRLSVLRLDEVEFSGKSVLDLGCNLGAFSRLAYDKGARRIVGVDHVADLAYEISNWLGYWNIDFLDRSLMMINGGDIAAALGGIDKFDIVFSMAIHNYMKGDVDWMADLCKETFIFEGHGGDPREAYEDYLNRNFDRVEHLGQTTDNYVRQVFRAEEN